MYVFSNNSSANLAAAISDTATSIQVTTGKSQLFHYIPSGRIYYQLATITDNTNYEIVKITRNSHTDTMTVVRGVNGTTAVAWPAGSVIEARLDAATLQMFPQLNYSTDLFDEMHPNGVDLQAGRSVATDCAAGDYSVAIGYSAKASELGAIAVGYNVDATAEHATAVGDVSSATGFNGTAVGYLANASATNATALGVNAAASNGAAVAIGAGVVASGDSAIAICNGADATGESAIAIGRESKAAQFGNIALGNYASSDGTATTWQSEHAYTWGDVINVSDDYYYCYLAGTSGASAPTWNTDYGGSITDGTAGWAYIASNYLAEDAVAVGRHAIVFGPRAASVGALAKSAKDGVSMGQLAISCAYGVAVGTQSYVQAEYGCAIGYNAGVWTNNYAIAIGAQIQHGIENSHIIGGFSAIQKAGWGISGNIEYDYACQETYVASLEIDLTQTAADEVVTFTIPSSTRFYPNELGLIVTEATTVTVQPQISFGTTGNATALKTQAATTKNAIGGRDIWSPLSGDGVSVTITASLKVSATATALKGRFYIKGLLVEDQ